MSILISMPSSLKAEHLSPMTPAVGWFWPFRSGHANSCWGIWRVGTLQSQPLLEELHKHLCAICTGGLLHLQLPVMVPAAKGGILLFQLLQVCKTQRWCFWQGGGKHHLFRMCSPNWTGSCTARAALATLLRAGCPCRHGLQLRLGLSGCIYNAKQKLAKWCRLAHPDPAQVFLRVRADKTTATVWRTGQGIRRPDLARHLSCLGNLTVCSSFGSDNLALVFSSSQAAILT